MANSTDIDAMRKYLRMDFERNYAKRDDNDDGDNGVRLKIIRIKIKL